MKTALRTLMLTLAGSLFLLVGEAVSVVVAPTAVYIDHRTRSATVSLFNPSSRSEEISIQAAFGYPATDGEGELRLHLEETSRDPRSAADWIRAYPERLVLAPGERQVVRLLVEPPADLADGEYWSRLIVTSRGRQLPVDRGERDDIRVGMDLELRTVISANYRKGPLATGVRVEDLEATAHDGRLHLRTHLAREGNAAYVGTMRFAVESTGGETVRNWQQQVAVYRAYDRRFTRSLGELPPGEYRLHVELTTERSDIAPRHRLRTAPVEAVTHFTVS